MSKKQIIVIGGGAAGFFAAITCAEANPDLSVTIIERGSQTLEKVRISGGGRCNVTNGCFEPRELVKSYPRGSKELLGPFHHFACGDTIAWFENHGVPLKIEDDGRVFPTSDNSESIVKCLETAARNAGVRILLSTRVDDIIATDEGHWTVVCNETEELQADAVMVATGSNPRLWKCIEELGHTVVPAVPSLFTFTIRDSQLNDLSGISLPKATVNITGTNLSVTDNLLITHWGLSGFSVLKLSSWAARELAALNYKFNIRVNWCPGYTANEVADDLWDIRQENTGKKTGTHGQLGIPHRLWLYLLAAARISPDIRWTETSKAQIQSLANHLCASSFDVTGKSTFKEEFVTAGGVSRKEIDFKSFSSKLCPGLYMAGEVLDIDALTGGFNFQAAWTGGWLAGKAMAANL